MTYSVVWIALPNGFAADGRARLSLVAAPRVVDRGNGVLGGSPLANWPGLVLPLIKDPVQLRVATGGASVLTPVQLDGPLPDQQLWRDLFPPSTVVDVRGRGAEVMSAVTAAPSFVSAAHDIDQLYGGVGGDASALRPGPSVEQRLDALAALVTDPGAKTRAGADAAIAAVTGISDFAAGLRTAPARASAGPANPLGPVRTVDNADFHQVVGLVMGHPELARALGLRIDLLMPSFTGIRSIRVVTADGKPLNGPILRPQSFSRVLSDPQRGRFVMATQPAGPGVLTEVVEGTLDASPDAAGSRYLVSTTDVASLSLQLVGLASARQQARRRARDSAEVAPGPEPVRLPVRRDVGFTVAQAGRPTTTVTFAADRAAVIDDPTTQLTGRTPAQTAALVPIEDGAAVLFADDVTNGYRVDVATDGGPFRSLMRRHVEYRVGSRRLSADDEGKVEPVTAVQQADGDGDVVLRTGEQLFVWNGWGLAVPKPGPKVLGVPGENGETTAPTPSQPAVGYDLRVDIAAVPGTLPRLRFGREYQFQVRTTDLAGNALDPAAADPAHALPKTSYRRKEAVPPPAAVPTARFTPGESLLHWVVRTDGDGIPIGSGSQRHLVPAKAPQILAERHGLFDAALGPTATPAARAAALQVAVREAGTLLDPTAPGPDGAPVPARGIAYVSNDPDAPRVARPARGDALPNGYYVIHDTPAMRTPYLPDPVSGGLSVIGLPGRDTPVVVPFAGTGWPDVQPVRVVVDPGTGAVPQAAVKTEAGRPTLHLAVPPGAVLPVEIATALRADRVTELETTAAVADLTAGLDVALSARQPVTIVHATQKPVTAPAFTAGPTVTPQADGSTVQVTATVACHGRSTGRVDVIAGWTETADTGEGDILVEQRTTTAASAAVAGKNVLTVDGGAHFGDRRHRKVTFTPVGTTAFREYFATVPDRDQRLTRTGGPVPRSIPSRVKPPLPDVHSIVPTFTWTNDFDAGAGLYTSNRFVRGVRVYLRRRWLQTGEGERLGVVVHTTAAEAESARKGGRRVQDFVSQWGGDPLQEKDDLVWQPMVPQDFTELAPRTVVELVDPGAKENPPATNQPAPPKPLVTVVSFPVSFDAERNLWFADIDLQLPATWPFVRLAVVRFQPESVAGRTHSRVVLTDFVQLPPQRQLLAQRAGGVGVKVEILGGEDPHSRFQLRQERRIGAPLVTAHDLGTSAGVGPTSTPDPDPAAPAPTPPPTQPLFTDADGWRLTDQRPGNGALGRLRLERAPGAPALDPTVKAELLAGRVVVEEIQTGMDVRGPGRTTRVVYTDVFDRSILGMS